MRQAADAGRGRWRGSVVLPADGPLGTALPGCDGDDDDVDSSWPGGALTVFSFKKRTQTQAAVSLCSTGVNNAATTALFLTSRVCSRVRVRAKVPYVCKTSDGCPSQSKRVLIKTCLFNCQMVQL